MRRLNLFFDADDTIFDFRAAERAAIRVLCREFGMEECRGAAEVFRKINDDVWKAFERGELSRAQIGALRFERLTKRYGLSLDCEKMNTRYKEEIAKSSHVIDGAQDLLQTLCERHNLYLVTNGAAWTQRSRLNNTGFGKYFRDIFISEEIGASKPRKEFFEHIFRCLGIVCTSDCYLIGDSLTSDIAGGINAGIATIWYAPDREADCGAIKPDYRVGDYRELLSLIAVLER